ncbi:hypothetical protein JW968_06410 [Candidatus Woesearchaeota archaeon]|nr:hypothetical protein [Candidatus Woesearchaeota archaeon]
MNKIVFSILLSILIALPMVFGQAIPDYGSVIIVRNTTETLDISIEPAFIQTIVETDKNFGGLVKVPVLITNPNTNDVQVEISATDNLLFEKTNFSLGAGQQKELNFLIFTDKDTGAEGKRESLGVIFRNGENFVSKSITVKFTTTPRLQEASVPDSRIIVSASTGDDAGFSFNVQNPYSLPIEVLISNPDPALLSLSEDRIDLEPDEIRQIDVKLDTSDSYEGELQIDVVYNILGKSITKPVRAEITITSKLPIIWIVLIALLLIVSLLIIFRKKKIKTPEDRILDEL